jgi:hypothetical protein
MGRKNSGVSIKNKQKQKGLGGGGVPSKLEALSPIPRTADKQEEKQNTGSCERTRNTSHSNKILVPNHVCHRVQDYRGDGTEKNSSMHTCICIHICI